MAHTLSRTGNLLALDEFHRELLCAMLEEDVPHTLTVDQARALVTRVRAVPMEGAASTTLLNAFLTNIDELLNLEIQGA